MSTIPTTSRTSSRRGAATTAASNRPTAAESTTATAASASANNSAGIDEDEEMTITDKPVARRGRVAAPVEIRPEQKEAMRHVATVVSGHTPHKTEFDIRTGVVTLVVSSSTNGSTDRFSSGSTYVRDFFFLFQSEHGVDCPSWYGFKNVEFVKKRSAAIGPGRQWRNYRQIVERENYHLMAPNIPTCQSRRAQRSTYDYSSIRSTPSSMPPRKYCDLTGFPAKYTDPKTHLHYYSASEYQQIKEMQTETIKQMLEIRNQTPSHQLMLR